MLAHTHEHFQESVYVDALATLFYVPTLDPGESSGNDLEESRMVRAESENARILTDNGIDPCDELLVRAIRLGNSDESRPYAVLGAGN